MRKSEKNLKIKITYFIAPLSTHPHSLFLRRTSGVRLKNSHEVSNLQCTEENEIADSTILWLKEVFDGVSL